MTRLYRPIGTWLRQYLPNFCWQTAQEVLTFLEQIDEDVGEDTVKVTLGILVRQGVVETRIVPRLFRSTGPRTIYQYKKV